MSLHLKCALKVSRHLIRTRFLRLSFCFASSLMIALTTVAVSAEERVETYSESSIKAALVYSIMHFVDWQEKELNLCVYQPTEDDVFHFNTLPKQTDLGQTLTVKFLHTNGGALIQNNCHVLFITHLAGDYAYEILSKVKNTHRLTIGESSQFIKNGGMVNFVHKESTIKFEINIAALKQANLNMKSQVLRIADKVYIGDE